MPTINILKDALFEAIGISYTDEEFGELCFDFGIELDEITSEKQIFVREKKEKFDDASDAVVYKIEVPANRYDLLCMEGLVRSLKVFLRRMVAPQYSVLSSTQRLIIRSETAQVRPFALAAVLRNITFTEASYNSFIDLQDKLHLTVGRKRTLVAIGTHDLDTVEGPFTYEALPPQQIKFKALNQVEEYTGLELMELYSHDSHLKEYLPIIQGKSVYPVIFDRNRVVLSMPPIINGDHSRISLNTKNVFIDITATDLNKAKIALDALVTMFSQYCDKPFTCECVEIEKPDGQVEIQPQLKYREQVVSLQMINQKIGINEPAENIQMFLSRMCFESNLVDEGKSVKVTIPPTRADILHPCDIIEDVAISFGFNNVYKTFPKTCTVGHQLPVNKLSDQIRLEVALLGFTEALTFALCSCDDISSRLRKKMNETSAVQIANPKTSEFQVARTSLLPGLLKTIAANKRMPIPLRIFEVADVVLKDKHTDVGAQNQRRLCAVYYNKTPGFEVIHGLLDRVMQVLNVANDKDFYYIKATEDSTYFTGWCAEVYALGKAIGKLGVIHPEVITAFDLNMPASAVEIDIEQFL